MRKYLVKRLLLSVVILFFVTFIIYLLMRCMPSSYVENMARQLSQAPGSKPYEEWLAQLNAQYGLDLGLIPGFFVQLKNLCTGNFGDSWKYTVPVIQKFNEVIWVSFIMGAISLVFELLIAVPLGIMTAAYLAEIAASRTRRIVKPFVELLAALPSVVIGFFGMVIVAPFLQDWFGADTGLNLLNAALMLAFMSVPTICSVAEDALFAVPRTLREASLALGATRWETLIRVVIPSALSGIGTAVMLGMSRAIGETMVVLMVAGGAAIIPLSIFDPVRPMPASIAAEMAEAPFRGDHYFALFATGIVLFLFTLLFNMLAFRIAEKHKQTGSSGL